MKPKKIISISITASVLISLFLFLALLRFCFNPPGVFSVAPLICGESIVSSKSLFRKLASSNMVTTSNIQESQEHSLAKGLGAKNLTDSDRKTMAYPASQQLDYTIDLIDTYQVKQINIVWGDSGTSDVYINHWSLEGKTIDGDWFMIAEGNFPSNQETVIKKILLANNLRLKAESEKNWFGINEVEVIARLP